LRLTSLLRRYLSEALQHEHPIIIIIIIIIIIAFHVLVCPWPIYNLPLAGLIPSHVVFLRLSLGSFGFCRDASAYYFVVLAAHTCEGVLLPTLVVVLSVMDVGCAFSAFSRCLLSCIFFFFFFVLQFVFRVTPLLLRSSTVIREVKASGTVF
jgi:hypothetical protein